MTGLLLITHGELGACLLTQARHVIGKPGFESRVLGVRADADPDGDTSLARRLCDELGRHAVIVTDLFGATPSNIAHRIADGRPLVHGLNLPMLLKAHTYAKLAPAELAERMVSGGQGAIFSGKEPPQDNNA